MVEHLHDLKFAILESLILKYLFYRHLLRSERLGRKELSDGIAASVARAQFRCHLRAGTACLLGLLDLRLVDDAEGAISDGPLVDENPVRRVLRVAAAAASTCGSSCGGEGGVGAQAERGLRRASAWWLPPWAGHGLSGSICLSRQAPIPRNVAMWSP
eukprot:scaffold85645_cov29-Tisochrysis_lutea.AAC.1